MPKSANLKHVTIYWHSEPNADKARGGWMPVPDHGGRQRGDTYGREYDLKTALGMVIGSVVVSKIAGGGEDNQQSAASPETHVAWAAGVSPDSYARAKETT